jgi:hypothetical protein
MQSLRTSLSILLFLFFINSLCGQGPSFNWAKSIGSPIDQTERVIALDDNSNIYIAGKCDAAYDFDPSSAVYTVNVTNGKAYLAKYDSLGNFLWVKNFGPSSSNWSDVVNLVDLKIDNTGNVLIVGSLFGSGDFDPSPGGVAVLNFTTGPGCPIVLKFDAGGSLLTAKIIGDLAYSAYGYGIATAVGVDKKNNILVTGSYSGVLDFDPSSSIMSFTSTLNGIPTFGSSFLAKYDSLVNYIWTKDLGVDNSNSIALDTNGTIFLGGTFNYTRDFNPSASSFTMAAYGSSKDIFMSKFTSTGNFVTAVRIGDSPDERCTSIVVDNTAHVYITGSFGSVLDFDPSPTAATNLTVMGGQNWVTSYDIYIAKFDSSLNLTWARNDGNYLNDFGSKIVLDKFNNSIVIGTSDNGNYIYTSAILLKYDVNGNYIFKTYLSGNDFTYGYGIAVDTSGKNIYAQGLFKGITDFEPYNPTYTLSSSPDYDCYLARYSPCTLAETPSVTSSANNLCPGQSLTLSVVSGSLNGANYWAWHVGTYSGSIVNTGTSAVVNPTTNTDYYVRGEGGCSYSLAPWQAISLSVLPSPVISITGPSYICLNDTATLVSSGANTYTWSNSVISSSINVSPSSTTSYTVSGQNTINNCISQKVFYISVVQPGFISLSFSNYPICAGLQNTITAIGVTSCTWAPGVFSNPLIYTFTSDTIFQISGINTYGCPAHGTNTVIVKPSPTISISGPVNLCQGESITLTVTGNASSYLWNTGATSNQINVSPTSSTIYNAVGSATNGCYSISQKNITVNPLPLLSLITSKDTACSGENITLMVTGTASSYSWNTGATGNQLIVSPNTNTFYVVTGTSINGCYSTVQKNIAVKPLPQLSLSFSKDTACVDDSKVDLYGMPQGGLYSGNSVVGNSFIIPQTPGSYLISYAYTDPLTSCSTDTSALVKIDVCTGFMKNNTALESTQLLPNPNDGNFYLISEQIGAEIEITNLNGQIIYKGLINQQKNSFNFKHFSKGVYVAKIKHARTLKVLKFIIE